jgi:glycerol-3-phosphate dehydrogenase
VATIADAAGQRTVCARALVNAAGPWVEDVIQRTHSANRRSRGARLIKGSHIVLPRLYPGDHAFLLQNPDRRVVFAIPYEGEFTLIGTTDEAWTAPPGPATIDQSEIDYLLDTVRRYFAVNIGPDAIRWTYSGIRPLHDDHAAKAAAVTRDYVLDLDTVDGAAPMLSVFGGKITTFRKLAEHALEKLEPHFPMAGPAWTAGAVLPGGDLPGGDFDAFVAELGGEHPALPRPLLRRLARAYGTRAEDVLTGARTMDDLGRDFGAGLTEAELVYLARNEWAVTAQDVLWRRSKMGLHVLPQTADQVDAFLAGLRHD